MAELRPYPIGALLHRMFVEHDLNGSIFDLPGRKFVRGGTGKDYRVRFHGAEAATPLGPAAGPQSQMAQNIVLSWLTGGRIMELKTVQINDELEIPRPCIDMQTVGYNVEWSQELKLEQSLEEYVKGSMLIEILTASGILEMPAGFDKVIFDMSVGYDLKGIQSDRVQAFVRGMLDATEVVDRLRAQIPEEFARYRDLDFTTKLSDTLTLSTFHGCPPDEIERIIEYLLEQVGLHCIIKLNPMLLGPSECRRLLHDVMGYDEITVPDTAFERDTTWAQAQGFVERLGERADRLGLGLGVKFSNTLIVQNERDFFPETEKEMYLSGPPLHVLAMRLVQQFRERFGDRYPISFSAGIDAKNFPDSVAIGLVPITVCSDLLKPGGYGRAFNYFKELDRRMEGARADDIETFILRAYGNAAAALDAAGADAGHPARTALREGGDLRVAAGDLFERWVSEAKLLNTNTYLPIACADDRYSRTHNTKLPRKIGSTLVLFDCITCDKCIPVCPNDANFTFELPRGEVPVVKLSRDSDTWTATQAPPLMITEKHQIGNFADFCNECGNCDVFCPEDGGPYIIKPRFFGSEADWTTFSKLDGFFIEQIGETDRVLGRVSGRDFELKTDGVQASFSGLGFAVAFNVADPAGSVAGDADGEVDLTYFYILDLVREGVLSPASVTYVRSLALTSC